MGLLKHFLLGNLGQSLDILDHAEKTETLEFVQRRHQSQLRVKDREIARLRTRTEKLHLAITALTRFLIDRGVVAEAELAAFLDEVDASDGKIDGKLAFEGETVKLNVPEKE